MKSNFDEEVNQRDDAIGSGFDAADDTTVSTSVNMNSKVQRVKEPSGMSRDRILDEDDEQSKLVDEDEDEVEFHYIELNGTNYFLDSEANELYHAITEEEVGELAGNIKKIKVRGNTYYRETIDNTFHTINSDGNFEYAGKIVKGRAVFKR